MERFIAGDEWTVAVFDYMVLPPIRIDTPRSFYDFRAKYEDDQTTYEFASDSPSILNRLLETNGLAACDAVGTSGVARVDLRVDQYGQPWILEVNTIPGFTSHSLVPKSALQAGMNFGTLCELSVRSCLAPTGDRRQAG
jgi:D-alanine-D-alanine ligase